MTVAYLDDIDQVQYKFTELGQTIEDLSGRHADYFKDTVDSLTKGFDDLKTMFDDPEFDTVYDAADVLDARVTEMAALFDKVLGGVSESFAQTITASEDAHKGIAKIADALQTVTEQPAAQASAAPGVLVFMGGEKKRKPGWAQKEVSSLKTAASSMMGKLKIPKPGTILAGGMMAAAYGFMYRDRVKKEMGEIKNTLEAAADYSMKGVRRKGIAAFSSLQENLQRYVGIAKGEVQAITQTFTGGGVTIGEMLNDTEKKFGRVGKSAVHSTLALDKMFGVPGGTMAQKAVSYMHNYGMSLGEANEMTRDLHLNDQAFKIGVPTFVQNVENAAESLKDFGFSIRGVMDVAGGLQERFEKIGVPKQFAGKLAGVGVQQMAQGIASMSDDWKVLLGQRMFNATGLEALQKFEEGFTRVKEGGGVEDYKDLIVNMYQVSQEVNEGDEAQMYAFMSRNMGLGSQGARAAIEIGKIYEKEGGIEAVKATEKHMKTFKSAFETEREKDSKFRQEMNLWMEGVSDVGQGLLGLVGKALAYLIGLFRAYPSMFSAMFSDPFNPDFARVARIQVQLSNLVSGGAKDWARMQKGFGKMGDAGKEMFGDVFASSIGALKTAFQGDLSGRDTSKAEGRPTSVGAPQMPTQTVYIPVASGAGQTSVEPISPQVRAAGERYARNTGIAWAGGNLSIVSRGVDEHGNIGLDLVGNCPRCGLIFGGMDGEIPPEGPPSGVGDASAPTSYTAEDEEALARMIQTEGGSSTAHGKGRAGVSRAREAEATMIGMTAINRLADEKKRFGKNLHEVITGTQGGGYGKQGEAGRAYGTRRKSSADSRRIAKRILAGQGGVGSGGATYFYHSHPGHEMVRGGKSLALPPFTRGMANVANVPLPSDKYKGEGHYARFYTERSNAPGGDAESREGLDEFLKEKHAKKHKSKARRGTTQQKQTLPEMM